MHVHICIYEGSLEFCKNSIVMNFFMYANRPTTITVYRAQERNLFTLQRKCSDHELGIINCY